MCVNLFLCIVLFVDDSELVDFWFFNSCIVKNFVEDYFRNEIKKVREK